MTEELEVWTAAHVTGHRTVNMFMLVSWLYPANLQCRAICFVPHSIWWSLNTFLIRCSSPNQDFGCYTTENWWSRLTTDKAPIHVICLFSPPEGASERMRDRSTCCQLEVQYWITLAIGQKSKQNWEWQGGGDISLRANPFITTSWTHPVYATELLP